MEKLLLLAVLSWLTGSPLLALLLVLLLGGAGWGVLSGQVFRAPGLLERWSRIRELRRAVATNPHDATARHELGRLLVAAGRAAEAVPHLEVARQRMPAEAAVLHDLGAARLGLGEVAAGRALIERAIGLDPKLRYGAPHLTLADSYLGASDPSAALSHLEALTSLHASTVEGRYKLARAYLGVGRRADAARAVAEALAVYRASPRFHRRLERSWRWRAAWLRGKISRSTELTPRLPEAP